MKSKLFLSLLIFSLAAIFRFYQLSQYPVSLSMDEAALVYNAKSILETGADEWNQKLPLAFKSAGDYKPPVNVYLTVPVVKIFGLNEISSRFVSAFLGSLTPVALMFLLLELNVGLLASFIASLWLAILPWHIHFSRGSFEAITALFLAILGLFLFLKWQKRYSWALPLAIISFSLSVWAYHAERLYVPVLVLALIVVYRHSILKSIKNTRPFWLLTSMGIFLLFSLPFIRLTFFSPAIMQRASATSILRQPDLSRSLHQNYSSVNQLIFDNNLFQIFKFWAGKYLDYFDFRFIFWKGMEFTHPGYPDIGLLYTFDLLIFVLGTANLIITKNKKLLTVFLVLFFLGPLPASFTMNNQHPLRALTWIPAFGVILSQGYQFLLSRAKPLFLVPVLLTVAVFNTVYFVNIYKNLFPYFKSEYWQYGYKEIGQYVCQNHQRYNQVIISDTFGSDGPLNTGLPYLYVLLACNYPTREFQTTQKTYNIEYRRVDWKHDQNKENMLIVASPWDILNTNIPESQIIKRINFKNGKPAFIFITTHESKVN